VSETCVGATLGGVSDTRGSGDAVGSGDAGRLPFEGVLVLGNCHVGVGIDEGFGMKSGGNGASSSSSSLTTVASPDPVDTAGDKDSGVPDAPRSIAGLPAGDSSSSSAGPWVCSGDSGRAAASLRVAAGDGGSGGSAELVACSPETSSSAAFVGGTNGLFSLLLCTKPPLAGGAAGVVEGPAAASGDFGSSLMGVNELDGFCVSANALPNP